MTIIGLYGTHWSTFSQPNAGSCIKKKTELYTGCLKSVSRPLIIISTVSMTDLLNPDPFSVKRNWGGVVKGKLVSVFTAIANCFPGSKKLFYRKHL